MPAPGAPAPTLLYLMGEPLPADMDGRVLTEIIDENYLQTHPISYSHDSEQAPQSARRTLYRRVRQKWGLIRPTRLDFTI